MRMPDAMVMTQAYAAAMMSELTCPRPQEKCEKIDSVMNARKTTGCLLGLHECTSTLYMITGLNSVRTTCRESFKTACMR